MKKSISNIHILFIAFCLCFVACERNEEVVAHTVTIENEQFVAQYPSLEVTCQIHTSATIEDVEVQLSTTTEFAEYIAQSMTLQTNGNYIAQLSHLTEDVVYYVRYEVGNRYTATIVSNMSTVFITSKPEITTTEPSKVSMYSAMVGGNVLKDNGYAVTSRGICYSTNENPTINDAKVERGKGLGSFTCELIGLRSGTVYYARAFATNANGTSYGEQVTFTTKSAPEVHTEDAISITSYSAIVSGRYTTDDSEAITECGICYSFSHNPTTADMVVHHAVAPSFDCTLSDLRPNTTYYARAYVTNMYGTAYGNEITFATTTNIPVVETLSAIPNSTTSIVAKAMVISDGGYTVVERGFCYGTIPTPTIANDKVTNEVGIGSFSSTISGLQAGITYYIRAYAISSEGIGYGEIIQVTM